MGITSVVKVVFSSNLGHGTMGFGNHSEGENEL